MLTVPVCINKYSKLTDEIKFNENVIFLPELLVLELDLSYLQSKNFYQIIIN